MKGYVTYEDRRYLVIGTHPGYDSAGVHRLDAFLRLRPFKGQDRIVLAEHCRPWQRVDTKRATSPTLHRGRPIVLELHPMADLIEVRQKGRRQRFTCTFGGLYDLLARQAVVNKKHSRAKHIGRKA